MAQVHDAHPWEVAIKYISTRRLTALFGCLVFSVFSAGAALTQKVLKLSHSDTAVGSRQKAAELFAAKVDEYSKGNLTVQVFHSGQLANDPKAVE
jgi:TRAP-type transport system periplasmic protein